MKISSYSWAFLLSSPFLFTSLNYAKEISVSDATSVIASLPTQEKIFYPISSIRLEIEGTAPDEQALKTQLEAAKIKLSITPVGVLSPTPGLDTTTVSITD